MGNLPPSDGMAGGPMPPGFFQVRWGGVQEQLLWHNWGCTCVHACACVCAHVCVCAAGSRPGTPMLQPPNVGVMPPASPPPPPTLFLPKAPPGSQPSPHAQPPPHAPTAPMMGPHPQVRPAAPPALPPPTSPSSHRSYPLLQPFMSPRYPGGPRPALRMNQVRFPPRSQTPVGHRAPAGVPLCPDPPSPPNRSPAATRGCPRLSAAAAQRHGPGCAGTG